MPTTHRYAPGRSSGGRSPRGSPAPQDSQPHGAALLYFQPSGTTTAANGRSSTGRAPVSNTGGWGFDSLRPCESWKVPRAPDPRPGREAGEQRGTGLTVTRPWAASPDPEPSNGEWGRTGQWTASGRRRTVPPHAGDGSGCLPPQRPTAETSWSPALRHEEGPADGRRRQPFRKRKARTGVRVRSSLPPPGSVGPAGVDARLSSGRSRVQVPYGARMRCAVKAALAPMR